MENMLRIVRYRMYLKYTTSGRNDQKELSIQELLILKK